MGIKTILLSICILLWACPMTTAQDDAFVRNGASVGAMSYFGDLSSENPYETVHPAFGATVSLKLNPMFSLRGNVLFGKVSASDADASDPEQRARNLSFESKINEVGLQLVGNFLFTHQGFLHRPPITPYAFIGLAITQINPQANLNGRLIDLQPLGTEGQFLDDPDPERALPEPYKLTQLVIPMGVGLRFRVFKDLDIEAEVGLRKMFTDYLDDVSGYYPNLRRLNRENPQAAALSDRSSTAQFPEGRIDLPRGNSSQKDWYMHTSLSITYILSWVRCPSEQALGL